MASTLYEIVMLSEGEFALQRTDERGEPLVRIRFSKEASSYLRDASLDVVRAMIDAGIDAVEQIGAEDEELSYPEAHASDKGGRVLH